MTTVISTHLDDAVFSAFGVIAGATVITVCAGIPTEDVPPTSWDRSAGFDTGAEAMRARRGEDCKAAELAGFHVVHLDFLDAGYGGHIGAESVADALDNLNGPVYAPLGLHHPDHATVSSAARLTGCPDLWLYEDLPYAYVWPRELAEALAGYGELTVTRLPGSGKEAAVRTYRSQITEDTHMTQILGPERYHRL